MDNWVERKFRRETAIKSRGEDLWRQLATAINDAVESYNKHYCGGKSAKEIGIEPDGRHLWLKRRESYPSDRSDVSKLKQISLRVSCDPDSAKIVASEGDRHPPIIIDIDAREDGTLFLEFERSEISLDEASMRLTQAFLFKR